MSGTRTPPALVHDARDLAQVLLGKSAERWRHTIGVARRAEELVVTLDRRGGSADAEILVAGAWLHDIGYAETVRDTGFHPLDGARHLDRLGWPARISGLVAHHSDAESVALARGMHHLLTDYPREESTVSDALTYADQTVGPNGRRMSFADRIADMLRRHGPDSPNAAAHARREPNLRAVADRVRRRLAESGSVD